MRREARPFDLEALPTVAEARRRFLAALPAWRPPEEPVPLLEAAGRVLSRDVAAGDDVPAFPRSMVDGFAVRSQDARAAMSRGLRVVGRVAMGSAPKATVGPLQAVWIPTGGPLPPGADAIVPVEATEAVGDWVRLREPVRPGDNVLSRGADVRAGQVVLPAGHRLRAADVGALASVGCTRPWVYRRPEVAILSMGDELVPPDRIPAEGQVRDANAYSLAAAVRADGGIPHVLGIVPDDKNRLENALRDALQWDMVLMSGGSSVGLDDVAAEVIAKLGPPGVVVHGVRLAPGKPTVLAVVGDRAVCGLPGNPVSSLVAYDLFVRPALYWRMGWPGGRPPATVRARLAEPLAAPKGREFHARVRLVAGPEGLVAQPVAGGSGQLATMARADGLVTVPLERSSLPAGETVEVRLLV